MERRGERERNESLKGRRDRERREDGGEGERVGNKVGGRKEGGVEEGGEKDRR